MFKFIQIYLVLFIVLGLSVHGDAPVAEPSELRLETFDAVWDRINQSYYDGDFGGLDWEKVGRRYRAKAQKADSMSELRKIIKAMLYELGESHLSLLSGDYDQSELEKPWGGGWSGADLLYAGDNIVFRISDENGPAYGAGIRSGDVLLEVGGVKVRKLQKKLKRSGAPQHTLRFLVLNAASSQLKAKPGSEVDVTVKPISGKATKHVIVLEAYSGETTMPLGNIGRMPLTVETKMLEGEIGYIRFNIWFPVVMQRIREFITTMPADASGLIIDIRGNPGGLMAMAGGLSGLLLDEQRELGRTTMREGYLNVVAFPQRSRWSGKVAILIDEGSVSTSEVFAIGLQELGRAKVFGQPTPGAALPSMFYELPNGDLLQVATGDFKTPTGYSLEGVGVKPNELVEISPVDISKGKDMVLQSAERWIRNTNPTK